MPSSTESTGAARTLVLGGIRSGKSGWAEAAIGAAVSAADRGPASGVRYIATGPVAGGDRTWQQRIDDHRRRRPRSWRTEETADVAGALREEPATATLVDDLGGWLTGVLDQRGWDDSAIDSEVDDLVGAVRRFSAPLMLVSPEVGLSVVPATAAGARFADELGRVNQRLAAVCEQVVMVVAGLPMWVKPTGKPES